MQRAKDINVQYELNYIYKQVRKCGDCEGIKIQQEEFYYGSDSALGN